VKGTATKILEAADRLLAEVGHDGMSMQAVADAAEVNKASVFYYFNSKSALVERVLERYYAAHLAALSEAFQTEGTLSERLHRLTDAYLDYIEANLRYPRLIQQQALAGSEHRELIQKNLAHPLGPASLAERRAHVHWVVDALLAHLTKSAG